MTLKSLNHGNMHTAKNLIIYEIHSIFIFKKWEKWRFTIPFHVYNVIELFLKDK